MSSEHNTLLRVFVYNIQIEVKRFGSFKIKVDFFTYIK